MIERKKRKCKGCQKERYIFSKGRCKTCASKGYKGLSKKNSRLRKVSPNKKKRPSRAPFFKKHIENIIKNNIKCMECNNKLQGTTTNVCHILSKGLHPEVEFEDNNIMYYCPDCHYKFDREISKRGEFKSFTRVLSRFKKIEHLLKDSRITNELKQLKYFADNK